MAVRDQPRIQLSLIRVVLVCTREARILSNIYPLSAQQILRSDWVDTQADLSLLWAQTHYDMSNMHCLRFAHSDAELAKWTFGNSCIVTWVCELRLESGIWHLIWHISISYTMGCPPVRGDNPRASASGLSNVQVDKHGITILIPPTSV